MTSYNIQQILSEADRPIDGDNRNRAIKNLNLLVNQGFEFSIIQNGKKWVSGSGKDFNIVIKYSEKWSACYLTDFSPYNILSFAGRFLQRKDVNDMILKNIDYPTKCGKCRGKGIIGNFMHYADGVCFDCAGSGTIFNKQTA